MINAVQTYVISKLPLLQLTLTDPCLPIHVFMPVTCPCHACSAEREAFWGYTKTVPLGFACRNGECKSIDQLPLTNYIIVTGSRGSSVCIGTYLHSTNTSPWSGAQKHRGTLPLRNENRTSIFYRM
jgi:hypothetical protein